MKWMQEQKKPALKVVNESLVQKRAKPKSEGIKANRLANQQRHRFQEDAIPPGTLCRLRKGAQEEFGFEYCTLIKSHVVGRHGQRPMADVLTPDGLMVTIDALWLRNDHVQNGNLEDETEAQ